MEEKKVNYSFGKLEYIFVISEVILLVLYFTTTEYPTGVSPRSSQYSYGVPTYENYVQNTYSGYQNIHVLVFIGIGMAMTGMRLHSWTSMTFNFLISCWVIQLNILVNSLFKQWLSGHSWQKVQIDLNALVNSDICALCVVISYGGIVGRAHWLQLWIVAAIEVFFFSLHQSLFKHWLRVSDQGGTLLCHGFAGFFGLGLCFFFSASQSVNHSNNISNYKSKISGMIGTLFIFLFWPSVNAAGATGDAYHRAVVNTILAMITSILSAAYTSRLMYGRLDMTTILNATLAGGTAIGTSCDIVNNPGYPILLGLMAGPLSAWGYAKLTPFLKKTINMQDQSGILNVQCTPAILGGLAGALMFLDLENTLGSVNYALFMQKIGASHRTQQQQFGYQLSAVGLTILLGLAGGGLAGVICNSSWTRPMESKYLFSDVFHFIEAENEQLFKKHYQEMEGVKTPQKRQEVYIQLNTETNNKTNNIQEEEDESDKLYSKNQNEYKHSIEMEQKKIVQKELDLKILEQQNIYEATHKERTMMELRNQEHDLKIKEKALELQQLQLSQQQQQQEASQQKEQYLQNLQQRQVQKTQHSRNSKNGLFQSIDSMNIQIPEEHNE